MARLPQVGGDRGNWGEILNEYLSVIHDDAGELKSGVVSKNDVGLGNVDNTADVDKPISTATQTVLDDKVGTAEVDAAVTDILLDPSSDARAATDDLYQQKGDTGSAATVAIGTVDTVPDGNPATITNSGSSTAAVFDFEIPAGPTGTQGDPGADGTAATIAVGTVDTVPDGSPATVANSGTSSAAVFDFEIPAGAAGAAGVDGAPGAPGADGADGADGTAATIAVGTVDTVPDGSPATVANSGTSSAAVLDFEIPAGPTGAAGVDGAPGAPGADGAAATIAVGTVATVPDGDPATITNSGTSSAAVFDFEIPTGPQGEIGTGTPGPPGPIGNTVMDTLNGGVFTLNPFSATEYTLTIAADSSLAASGLTNGTAMTVTVVQDGVGGHSLTLPSSWIGAADFTLATTAGEYDVLVIWRSPLGIHAKRVHTGQLPATIWTPQQLANQQCWYNGNAIALDDGDSVATWSNTWTTKPDLTASATAPVMRLLHGEKYVEFTGSSSTSLDVDFGGGVTIAQPMTIALAVRINGTGEQPVINGAETIQNNSPVLQVKDTPQNWYARSDDLNALTVSGDWEYVVYQVNGSSSSVRRNGTQASCSIGGTLTLAKLRLARSDGSAAVYGTIDIAEVLVFGHLPDSAELANLESYLSDKVDVLNGIA